MKRFENKPVGQLGRRMIKQAKLFHSVSELNRKELTLEELIQSAAKMIRAAQEIPEQASVLIEYGKWSIKTDGFCQTPYFISARNKVTSDTVLLVKIFTEQELSFPEEEQTLLDAVVAGLASKIDLILTYQSFEKRHDRINKAYKLAHIGTWEYDMVKEKLHWSDVTKEVHGFDKEYKPDIESTINLFKQGFHKEVFAQAVDDAIENEQPFDLELQIISGKGDERWIRAAGHPEYEDGVCTRFYGISQNVTDRRQAEEGLQQSERRFKALVQDGSDLISIVDAEGNYKYVSPTSESVLGIPPEEFIGQNAHEYVHKDDQERVFSHLSTLRYKESRQVKPYRFMDSTGNWRWLETTVTNLTEDPAVGGYVTNSRDITERQKQQQEIMNSLREKETLLAEIHHRVKNNLAVITGMLQLQAFNEENEAVLTRLNDCIGRVHTMADIHEQLYQSKSFSQLDFGKKIRQLVLNIQKTFQNDIPVDIFFRCDPVKLSISQALPCSLILNEIITNIFKHAFVNCDKGTVEIILKSADKSGRITLQVSDNGTGLPDDFGSRDQSSMGMTLIDLFSKQLKADHKFKSPGQGSVFTLSFEKEEI